MAHLKRVILLAVVIRTLQTVLMPLCLKVVKCSVPPKNSHLVIIVVLDAIGLSAVAGEWMIS